MKLGPALITYPGLWGYSRIEGYPVSGDVSSPFGPRTPFQTDAGMTRPFHSCIHNPAPRGTPLIYPGERGLVTAEGPAMTGAGNAVFINDVASGRTLLFAHLQPGAHVGVGQWLNRGQVVGQVGTTGASTGTHLHFGVTIPNLPTVVSVNTWFGYETWADPFDFFVHTIENTEVLQEPAPEPHVLVDFIHSSILALALYPPNDIGAALTELGRRVAYLRTII